MVAMPIHAVPVYTGLSRLVACVVSALLRLGMRGVLRRYGSGDVYKRQGEAKHGTGDEPGAAVFASELGELGGHAVTPVRLSYSDGGISCSNGLPSNILASGTLSHSLVAA